MQDAKQVKCYGEAHSNPYIDNCGICLGHSWGAYFACPTCNPPYDEGHGHVRTYKLRIAASGKSGQCPQCRKRFNTSLAKLDEAAATLNY